MTDRLDHFRAAIERATRDKTPLQLVGSGSKHWYGEALQGAPLDTRGHAGVVAYDPAELVITARCGTPLAEIEATLAEQGQMLAFEPPHFGPGATLGGCVAAGLSGPRRQAAGALRDFMLGVQLLDGQGRVLNFGGQVMKNVAGYDVARLLPGSLGVLGLILQVSLKVLPKPFAEATLRFELPETEALSRLNQWGGQPLPISASAWQYGVLHLRLSGAEAAVAGACAKLGGERIAEADCAAFWQGLREQTAPFFAEREADEPLWRLALPSTAQPVALPGAQLIEWGGGQRWWRSDAPAAQVRTLAEQAGGHATLWRGGDHAVGVFTPLAAPLLQIQRRLKAAFDPAGVFNPGRLYPAL
ncbi:glycolate oxidase subunit GlcE [Crenobacter sp. SG2305]|uniref:glycolate oxidase subunit GlcE n=1 Tax=Crenobacter oryzisoli TaxID=3056844 RepID=UPI0025AA916D|nr:glycolate oxidase subunit GlcE [Crenobacter sp. SG2305]MDN0084690.1 glycolate oxidase subunit GlcE [Crenobacter sp. SG2305]